MVGRATTRQRFPRFGILLILKLWYTGIGKLKLFLILFIIKLNRRTERHKDFGKNNSVVRRKKGGLLKKNVVGKKKKNDAKNNALQRKNVVRRKNVNVLKQNGRMYSIRSSRRGTVPISPKITLPLLAITMKQKMWIKIPSTNFLTNWSRTATD